MEQIVQQTEAKTVAKTDAGPVANAESIDSPPEKVVGTEGTEQQETQGTEQQVEETPEKRESRSRRRFNRERDRRIAAETELRLLKESQQPQARPAQQQQEERQEGTDPQAPTREQFASYEEFIRADATYNARKEATKAAREVIEAGNRKQSETQNQQSAQKAREAWEKQLEAARDEIEDFDDVIKESDTTYTPAMGAAILESDHGARLSYYLAQHPEEASRIAKLKPSRQAAEIVALESKVAKPAKAPSKAPAPIDPVGGKDAVATQVPTTDPRSDKMSTEAWIAAEKVRMREKGIRY